MYKQAPEFIRSRGHMYRYQHAEPAAALVGSSYSVLPGTRTCTCTVQHMYGMLSVVGLLVLPGPTTIDGTCTGSTVPAYCYNRRY